MHLSVSVLSLQLARHECHTRIAADSFYLIIVFRCMALFVQLLTDSTSLTHLRQEHAHNLMTLNITI